MANALQICRICLSVNVKMFTLKNTNMENLYTILTHAYIDIEDGKPTTVCFLCYARLRQCNRLQQQALKSNDLLEQMLGGRIMHATANAILNNQYSSQDLQVSSTYYLDLKPADCKDVLLEPKLEANSLLSVKREVEEAIDEGHNVSDFPEDINGSYDFDLKAIHSDSADNQVLRAICSNKSDKIEDIAHGMKWRKRQEDENLCLIYQEKEVKRSHNENAQNKCVYSTKTPVINTTSDEFQCNECGKQFSTKDILTDHIIKCMKTEITHIRTHTGEKPFSCNICEYRCSHKGHFKIHMRKHTREKPFSCNICGYRCARKDYLKTHMMNHTGERPFSCDICEYRCIHKGHLKTHMRKHTGEKPFSCNICDYRCARNGYMKTHMMNHTGEKPFSCTICKYRCARKLDLKTHMINHTVEKPFFCNICECKYARKGDLKTHMMNHTGEKPFSCNICKYTFPRKCDLKRHMQKHTGEKPFSCNICDFRCACKSNLNRHMRTHTD